MECVLSKIPPSSRFACRGVRPDDEEPLAALLYASYRGTLDDEGGSFSDAVAEIEKTVAGGYGPFLPECSFVIEEKGRICSASLVTWFPAHNAPLLAFLMTMPDAQRRGMARAVLTRSMRELRAAGHSRLTLVVTEGNRPALRLYTSMGFRTLDPF